MTMRLYLMRHADVALGKKESAPELTSKGLESLKRLLSHLDEKEFSELEEIRHSSMESAKETARQFKKIGGLRAKVKEAPLLMPYDDFRILADIVATGTSNVMLVGHQPNLGMLASYLLAKESRFNLIELKKTGMLCLEKASVEKTQDAWTPDWKIRWLINPRILKKKLC